MRNTMSAIVGLIFGFSFTTAVMADQPGRNVNFQIDQNGALFPQLAQVAENKVFVKGAGGDPELDLIFDEKTITLFVISHRSRSYYRIDENVISKAASMIESLSAVAESQGGVLSDLLDTLGISSEEEESRVEIVKTDTILSAANINCQLFQQFRNERLESELCIAPKNGLSALAEHYATLEAFYLFGDQLISKAGSILQNIGLGIPNLSKLGEGGLPIMAYVASEKLKISVTGVSPSIPQGGLFDLPAGYTEMPIPFLG